LNQFLLLPETFPLFDTTVIILVRYMKTVMLSWLQQLLLLQELLLQELLE
jgi:hypothetical protein